MESVEKERMEQILRVDVSALLKTIQNLENKLSQSPAPVNIPIAGVEAIFSKLEGRLSALEIQQRHAFGALNSNQITNDIPQIAPKRRESAISFSPTPKENATIRESFDFSGAAVSMVHEEKIMAKIRGEIEAKINASQVSFDSKVNFFTYEVDRLQKLLTIRPTTSELQQVIYSVNEMDHKLQEGVEQVQARLLAQLKNIVAGEMSSLMHELKTTKVLNEQSIALVNKKIDAQTLDVADVKQAFQDTMDLVQPEIKKLRHHLSEVEQKLTELSEQLRTKQNESEVKIQQLEEALFGAQSSITEQNQNLVNYMDESAELRSQDLQSAKDIMDSVNEKLLATSESLTEFQKDYDSNRIDVESRVYNLSTITQEHSEKLELESNKRRKINNMLDELLKQDLQGKMAKHDEHLNKLDYDLVDSRVLIDSLSAIVNSEVANLKAGVKILDDDIKTKVKVAQTQQAEKISQLFQFDLVNKSNIEHLSGDVSHLEKITDSLLSLKPRVGTLEEICAVFEKDLISNKDALTTTIDNSQDLANRLNDALEKIDEIDESIVNRMNSVRDNLMEVLLEKQTEVNLNLKNVRENLEVMAHVGDRGAEKTDGFPPLSSGTLPLEKPAASVLKQRKANFSDDGSSGRHIQMDAASRGSAASGYNVVDSKESPATYRKPTMDGVLLKGLNLQPRPVHQDDTSRSNARLQTTAPALQHSQSQPLPANTQVKVMEKSDRIHGRGSEYKGFDNSNSSGENYLLFAQSQFVAELCINFEDISVKKKRVNNIPPVLCQSISAVTQELSEFMAKTADAEMVQYMILIVSSAHNQGPVTKDETIPYDENFVLTRRHLKMEEFMAHVTSNVTSFYNNQPGIVRHEARVMFLSAVKKSLEMFMTKHNQVLTIGNSRLGRVKIPTCIACDRPLLDKVSLETAASQASSNEMNGGDDDDNSFINSKYGAVGAGATHNSLQPLNVNNKVFLNRAKGVRPKMEIEGDAVKLPMAVSPTLTEGDRPKTNQKGAVGRKVDFENKMPVV